MIFMINLIATIKTLQFRSDASSKPNGNPSQVYKNNMQPLTKTDSLNNTKTHNTQTI